LPLSRLKHFLAHEQYREAQREGERLIHLEPLDEEDLAMAYKGTAMASYYLREVFGAAKLGEKALEVAQRTSNWELINKTRFDLAEYYLTIGDYAETRDHLIRLLTDLQHCPNLTWVEAWAHHNLALVFRYHHQYDSALASHHLSADMFQRQGDSRRMMEAWRGIIWCYLELGRTEDALPYLYRLSHHLNEEPHEQLAASLLTDWAHYYQKTGDLRSSMSFCMDALSPNRPGVDDHIMSTAAAIAGENALTLNRLEEAQIFAGLAEEYALRARRSALMNRATQLRRRLCERGYASA